MDKLMLPVVPSSALFKRSLSILVMANEDVENNRALAKEAERKGRDFNNVMANKSFEKWADNCAHHIIEGWGFGA